MSELVYLDHAASSGHRPPAVAAAVAAAMAEAYGNPGRSAHPPAIAAARAVFEARDGVAELIGAADPEQVLLGSSCTLALNTALAGLLEPGDRVLHSAWEHNAAMRPLRQLAEARGLTLEEIPAAADGPLDLDALEQLLERPARAVVALMASNVTGAILPLEAISERARAAGALLIVDAAQGAGLLDLDVQRLPLDALALAGHKGLLGPMGTGALYLRDPQRCRPLITGGTGSRSERETQPEFPPDRFESGTPNVPGLAGLAAGVAHVRQQTPAALRQRTAAPFERLLAGLEALDGVVLHGPRDPARQLPVASFETPGRDIGEVGRALGARGVCCRTGLHCAPRAHRTLGTLERAGTIRWSLGPDNTIDGVERALAALRDILERPRGD